MILKELPPTSSNPSRHVAMPTVSISAARGALEEGEPAVFSISTLHAVNSGISVKINLNQSGNFVIGPMHRTVDLIEESLGTELVVQTHDDRLAELDGRITATIQEGSGYLIGTESTAHVIVSDAFDRQHRKNSVSNVVNTVLPDLLAHSTSRTYGIATERIAQAFSGNSASSIELNGSSPALTMLRSGGEMLNGSETDWRSLIDGSSFTVALFPEIEETNSATVWGIGDKWSFSGNGGGVQQSWDGETHTGHFGFDARVGNGMLAGMALSISQSEIGYGQTDDSGMSFVSMTRAVHPFWGYISSDGNSQMQAMVGHGENELELKQEEYLHEILNGSFHTVGLSGSNRLYSKGNLGGLQNLELSIAGEAWYSQQSVDSVEGVVDDMQVEAHHVRIAIEETHNYNLGASGIISPSISIGLRGDGRNEKSAYGLDVGNEIRYKSFNGLEIAGSGVSMLSGLNLVHRWEIGSSLDYAGNDGKGLQLSMSSSWSNTGANAKRYIWGSELVGVSKVTQEQCWDCEIEIGYGFEILDRTAVMTPFYAINNADVYGSESKFGSRLKTNSGVNLEFGTVRDVSETGSVELEHKLTGTIAW